MYFAYVDESGDPGDPSVGGSKTYTLGCVLSPAATWTTALDDVLRFRKGLRNAFGVPVRAEVKADFLLRGRGACTGLPSGMRFKIYRAHLRLIPKIESRAFAIVIDKRGSATAWNDCKEKAWTYLLQRLERFSTKNKTGVMLIHDDGDAGYVRKRARKARRFQMVGSAHGTGPLSRPFVHLVEDSVARNSAQSYFIQMADLVAYSAFREVVPFGRPGRPAIAAAFAEIGSGILTAVNMLKPGQPPGVVVG